MLKDVTGKTTTGKQASHEGNIQGTRMDTLHENIRHNANEQLHRNQHT